MRFTNIENEYVAGVDGGGSSTRVALATRNGRIVGYGQSGPANYGDVGLDAVKENLAAAFSQAWEQAGVSARTCAHVFLGLANVVSAEDREAIKSIAIELGLAPDDQISVDHDIRIALVGGLAGKPGIVTIVGTGTSCYGRSPDGQECRVGGWSYLVDDLGSGYWLGVQAMVAAVQATDGRGAATLLTDAVLEALKIDSMDDFMRRVYHGGMTRREIASLARLVFDAAPSDDVAEAILRQGAGHIADLARVAAKRLGVERTAFKATYVGGIVDAYPEYGALIRDALVSLISSAEIVAPVLSPTKGAVLAAILALGDSATPELIRTLGDSHHAP